MQNRKKILEEWRKKQDYQKKLKLLEEQRRSGKFGQQQKEWQKEQDKLFS